MSGYGYIQLKRGHETEELIKDRNAFVLLAVIALRARRTDSLNIHNLASGEALLGDFKNYGLTEQEYRSAKERLKKWGLATFRRTNKGTIAKLTDTRIYNINITSGNEQKNRPPTQKKTFR